MRLFSKSKALIVVAILLFCCLLFAISIVVDNASLRSFEDAVIDGLSSIDCISLKYYKSACCNTSGTGNNTDLYVAVLVKCNEQDIDKVKSDLSKMSEGGTYFYVNNFKDGSTLAMDIAGIEFDCNIEDSINYYIIEFIKAAPLSFLDIRGN